MISFDRIALGIEIQVCLSAGGVKALHKRCRLQVVRGESHRQLSFKAGINECTARGPIISHRTCWTIIEEDDS